MDLAALEEIRQVKYRYLRCVDLKLWDDLPKLRAWRARLGERPSVRAAVGPDYARLLHGFLARHDAQLLKLAA